MIRLENVLGSWKTIRQDTAQAVEDFPAGELDFKPAPDLMSFREIARHILNAALGLTGVLLDGETNFANPAFREKMKAHVSSLPDDADGARLASALRTSLDAPLAAIGAQSQDWLAGIVTRFDGQPVTRLEMIQTLKEHELTHRSQLFLYLRLKGIVPVTTRRRLAQQAGR